MEKKSQVYVLRLENGMWYVGFTRDLAHRVEVHFKGEGSWWTKCHPPIELVEV